jgi:hypothetical protein
MRVFQRLPVLGSLVLFWAIIELARWLAERFSIA